MNYYKDSRKEDRRFRTLVTLIHTTVAAVKDKEGISLLVCSAWLV